jgi:hypothetical protein
MTKKDNNVFLRALGNAYGQVNDDDKEPMGAAQAVEEQEWVGQEAVSVGEDIPLSMTLLDNGYHPVLIFGTRATGKTTFLTSMLAFFTSMPDSGVTVTLGDQLSHSEAGVLAHESAEKLFHLQVSDYISGTAPVLNQDPFPFFVPLELRKAGLHSITRVALMESSGELWNVKNQKNHVQKLRTEIIDIYENYSKPLSVITVVPYAMSEGYMGVDSSLDDKNEFRISDASLLQTLQIYQRHRPAGIEDQFYFVLTKWDMHTQKIATEEFYNPNEELVAELVEQRFPRSYNFFKGMSHGHGAKITPYSAGLIGGTTVLEVPRHLRPLLQEFPYRLWRWIYANATDGGDLYGSGTRARGGRISNFFRELFS